VNHHGWRQTIIPVVIAALIGALLGMGFVSARKATIESTITFGNIVQSVSTLGAAIVVSAYLQKHAAADRKEKDIVLRYFDFAIDTLNELEVQHQLGGLVAINSSLKKLTGNCAAATTLCKRLKYETTATHRAAIADLLQQVRAFSTLTPIDSKDAAEHPERDGATVKDNVITYTPTRAALLALRVDQLRIRLLDAQIAVNEAARSLA
jgi:hypothetical protein